ncbi:hypothetical protein ILUMI_10846 [Ignelater luminosus]|uniref:C2H2-type domain-containing protein n=1 Tax=Ignelater luminosus TaxID=2038154 RepID=A0A8K0CX35_IGNLU|nr:hypothetical protein ILUMI_10846 [Ignelater luminosus]
METKIKIEEDTLSDEISTGHSSDNCFFKSEEYKIDDIKCEPLVPEECVKSSASLVKYVSEVDSESNIDIKSFKCEICHFKCSSKYSLRKHIMLVHPGKKFLECDVCNMKLSHPSNLRRHGAIHTKERPFKCDICNYRFSLKQYLKRHKLIHARQKPFKCEICNMKVSLKEELQQHMLVHTGERPFKCDICCYSSSHKSTLEIHMRIHTVFSNIKFEKINAI